MKNKKFLLNLSNMKQFVIINVNFIKVLEQRQILEILENNYVQWLEIMDMQYTLLIPIFKMLILDQGQV